MSLPRTAAHFWATCVGRADVSRPRAVQAGGADAAQPRQIVDPGDDTDPKICELGEAVYAWITADGKPVRIGTCGASAGKRLLSYPGYINRSLTGRGGATPKWEALKWLGLLTEHGMLTAVVHRPEPTLTAAGLIRPYLDVERQLIRQHRPLLNRGHR